MSKAIHTEDEWRVMLEELQGSGETVKGWLEKRGIPLSQYYYWRRRLSREDDESAAASPKSPVFVELKMDTPEDPTILHDPSFTPEAIVQVGTYRLYVGKSISLQTLTTVLTALNNA